MKMMRYVPGLLAAMVAATACAQAAPEPLNLNLPPEKAGASHAPASDMNPKSVANGNAIVDAMDASNPPTEPARTQPGMRFDDPDGVSGYSEGTSAHKCDDAANATSQVHGSASVGVIGGSHGSGNYQAAVMNLSQALGSCDKPTGDISISVGVERGNFESTGASGSRKHPGWRR